VKEAWEVPLPTHGLGKSKGEGIIIVHPDTGWTAHPELIDGGRYMVSKSYNFFETSGDRSGIDSLFGEGNVVMQPSHGTATASLMLSAEGRVSKAGYPNYLAGVDEFVSGVAPKVEVVPFRVVNSVWLGTTQLAEDGNYHDTYSSITQAIFHGFSVDRNKVGVVSISLGGLGNEFPRLLGTSDGPKNLTTALKAARRKGVVVIAAAASAVPGNDPSWTTIVPFPGGSDHTIGVAGCYDDSSSFKAPVDGFYGPWVDITAPGWGVIVAKTKKPYYEYHIDKNGEGTSYSTAIVAGACALWQAYHSRESLIKKYGRPLLTDVFRYCLKHSCETPFGWDKQKRGSGILNAEALLKIPLPSIATAEEIASKNSWPKDVSKEAWGPEEKWGRESI
jgi:serine protease